MIVMPTSSPCNTNHDDVVFLQMQSPMMSCHLIPMWHEWNVNAGDIMVMWFASYATLVTA